MCVMGDNQRDAVIKWNGIQVIDPSCLPVCRMNIGQETHRCPERRNRTKKSKGTPGSEIPSEMNQTIGECASSVVKRKERVHARDNTVLWVVLTVTDVPIISRVADYDEKSALRAEMKITRPSWIVGFFSSTCLIASLGPDERPYRLCRSTAFLTLYFDLVCPFLSPS